MTKPRVSADVPPLAIGEVVGEKYVVESRIGEGAFAVVYGARHQSIASLRVAIKVLKPSRADSEEVRRRFQREALTAASLNSPFTVSVMDVGETLAGLPYMVLEYIDGEPLDVAISRAGRLGDRVVGMIAIQVLHALNEAHAHGIMHRDIKPANLMLVHDKKRGGINMKVLDFGIARIFDDSVLPMGDGTITTSVHCTPLYASPEVLRGEPSQLGDLYALGISLIQALDGRPPYMAATAYQVANLHLDSRPVPLGPHASTSRLAPIIRRATEKNPLNRYATAGEMLDDLEREFRAELGTGALSARIPTADFEIPDDTELTTARASDSVTVAIPTQVLPPRPVSFGAVTRGSTKTEERRVSRVESSDFEALAEVAGESPMMTQGRVASSQPNVAPAPPPNRESPTKPAASPQPQTASPTAPLAPTAPPDHDDRAASSLVALLSGPDAASGRFALLAGGAFVLAAALLLAVALPMVSGSSAPEQNDDASVELTTSTGNASTESADQGPTAPAGASPVASSAGALAARDKATQVGAGSLEIAFGMVIGAEAAQAASASQQTAERVAESFPTPVAEAPVRTEPRRDTPRAERPERRRSPERVASGEGGTRVEAPAPEPEEAEPAADEESEPANPFGGLQPMGL